MAPILLIIIPLIVAFLSILVKQYAKHLLTGVSIVNAILAFTIYEGVYLIGGFKAPFGINLTLDAYSLYSIIFLNVLFAFVVILLPDRTDKISSILLVALAALNGLLMTGDLFNLFVFLEIASIAAFMIIATNKKYLAVFNYLVMATVGSSLYLLGVVLLYVEYGSLNMNAIHDAIAANGLISSIPIILIFIGLAVEIKLIPLNGWVKGVLQDSDPLVGTMIASIFAGTMLMVFGRLFTDVFVLSGQLQWMLGLVAIVTIIGGEAAAFSSKKIREILLYSSVAQSGLAALLFIYGLATVAILVVIGNVIVKLVMFMIASHIADSGTDEVSELKGIFKSNPLNGLAFSIAGLSLIGLPMFFGFAVKMNVLIDLFKTNHYILPIIILAASLVEGAYIIRMLVALWNPGNEGEYSKAELATKAVYPIKFVVCLATLLLSLALFIFGFIPDSMIKGAGAAGADLSGNINVISITAEGGDQ